MAQSALPQEKTVWQWIISIDDERVIPSDGSATGNLRDHRRKICNSGFLEHAAFKCCANNQFVDQGSTHLEFALREQLRHAACRAGSGGTAIQLPVSENADVRLTNLERPKRSRPDRCRCRIKKPVR
jgi:hypothetical protein